jgi:hypothetical protein
MLFKKLITKITMQYNISYSEQLRRSPHEAIFTYQPWIYPELKKYRKGLPDHSTIPPTNTRKTKYPMPNIGEIWKVKRKNTRKSDNIYEPAEVLDRTSYHIYKIKLLKNNTTTSVHIRNLAKISNSDCEKYKQVYQDIDTSERPLRNPRERGSL